MGEKILIVDDDPDVLEALKVVLESKPYTVITARDGLEGLERVRQENPDLVILDLLMPRLDGFAVVRALKEDPRYAKYSEILILTAVGGGEPEAV